LSFDIRGQVIFVTGFDYSKFKLFALSVLWRAGISKSDFFSSVRLGPHEEKLRKMIANSDPGEPYQYPFLMGSVIKDGIALTHLISQSFSTRTQGYYTYRFIFAGIVWYFLVASHQPPPGVRECCLQKDGSTVMLFQEFDSLRFISKFIRALESENAIPKPKQPK
jgi:hypothetical protein